MQAPKGACTNFSGQCSHAEAAVPRLTWHSLPSVPYSRSPRPSMSTAAPPLPDECVRVVLGRCRVEGPGDVFRPWVVRPPIHCSGGNQTVERVGQGTGTDCAHPSDPVCLDGAVHAAGGEVSDKGECGQPI